MRRTWGIGIGLLAAWTALWAAQPAPAKKPKLVLAIVVDQFRYDYLLRFRGDYNSGLARLLDRGAVFTDAHYLHALTVTAVGHSTILSGATPSVSGIVANEWYDRESGGTVTSVSDPATKLVGGTPDTAGSSPRRLLVSTVGDELKMSGAGSKVIGVSIKDRSAILPVGHMADGAYWFDNKSNHWVTSTYYREALPDWVRKINDTQPAQRYATSKWLPLDARGDSVKAFCTMVQGAEIKYCGNLESTPWGNELIEEFAEQALAAENLGGHAGSDVLSVSFSSNDYVGHNAGPESPDVRDMSIRTDRLIGKLLDAVDRRVGAGNTLVLMTADHGVAPIPEVNQARNMPGGRIANDHLSNAITAALEARYGSGKWLLPGQLVSPYLNLDLIHSRKLDRSEVERVAAEAARTEAHVARVFTRQELLNGGPATDMVSRAVSLAFFGPRSGDLYILQEPYYLFEKTGTSHGTPYTYDNHVPVIFLGPGIKAGRYAARIAVNDIAPTLAALLGVEQPSGSIGRVLSEMLE